MKAVLYFKRAETHLIVTVNIIGAAVDGKTALESSKAIPHKTSRLEIEKVV